MIPARKLLALSLIAAAGVAAGVAGAKEGVQNPAVKARMDAMAAIGASTRVLGDMAGGKADFDAAKAAEAAAAINATALTVPGLFEAPETDPVSEAKPEIWANWADFVAKTDALAAAAAAVDTSSLDGVKAGMGALGGSCKACHSAYRL